MSSKFLPGDRYVVLGTKNGSLLLIDIQTGEEVSNIPSAHSDTIWSIDVTEKAADTSGVQIMTGSSDSYARFFELRLIRGKISLVKTKEIFMGEAV